MPVELFSRPSPDYRGLVKRLYGAETGELLANKYESDLGSALWKDRIAWFGLGVREEGQLAAHAIVQLAKDKPVIYVGYVESVADRGWAETLVQAALAEVGHERRGKSLFLPVDLSIWHTYRFKARGGEVLPFEAASQPYYDKLFEGLLPGVEGYSSYRFALPRIAESSASRQPFSIRQFSAAQFSRDLRRVYEMSAAIFGDEHSLPSFEEFCAIYGGAGATLDPRYILIAEEGERAVGFIYAIRQGAAVYIKTFGVRPGLQRHGVGTVLFDSICRNAAEDGCQTMYGLMIKNDRPITRLLPAGARRVSEYVLYRQD